MNIKKSIGSFVWGTAEVAVTIVIAFFLTGYTPVKAQGVISVNQSQFSSAMNNALWSLTWGSDGTIDTRTNGVSVGPTGSPMIAGGASYTSDTWSMALTFSGGNVSIAATSVSAPGLFWNVSYPLNSSAPVTNLLLGANYQADNGESLTIDSVSVNNIPIGGPLPSNASQSFSAELITDSTPITLLNYNIDIGTPTTWERQNLGQGALLSTVAIPGINTVPEPGTSALLGIGLLVSITKLRKK
jgi:hypothetical protein